VASVPPSGETKRVAILGNSLESPELEPMRFANARPIALAPELAAEVISLRAQAAKDKARIERLGSYLASCIAMIEHAIGPGRDVFIEPDTKRRLSDARAALEDGE